MENWKSLLRGIGRELEIEERNPFPEDPIDTIIRRVYGPQYKPKHDQVVGRVVRNHRAPYLVNTVGGVSVLAYPGRIEGILEGDFVNLTITGSKRGETGVLYKIGDITGLAYEK